MCAEHSAQTNKRGQAALCACWPNMLRDEAPHHWQYDVRTKVRGVQHMVLLLCEANICLDLHLKRSYKVACSMVYATDEPT